MIIDESDYLEHYGTPRKSGRYPWGSGTAGGLSNREFADRVAELRSQGLTETQIAQGFEMSTTELRTKKTLAKNEKKQEEISTAIRLHEKGMSNTAIALQMFGTKSKESNVRALLADNAAEKAGILNTTAEMLREKVGINRLIDIGTGVEQHIGISATRLAAAVGLLREEGYQVHSVPIPTAIGNNTTTKVLAPPGTTWGQVMKRRSEIEQIVSFSDDGGRTRYDLHPPLSIDSKRISVKYKEDGGGLEDGVIYVRPGVDDVSIDKNNYAQVRILVDGTHYLKGMALYKDDLPPGTDLLFNTNKSNTGNKKDAFKKVETDPDGRVDPDNPFGSRISRQIIKKDAEGNEVLTSAMNLVNEEGTWSTWSKTLSTQFLSKQSPKLAKGQLDMTYEQRLKEFEKLKALTNPTIRKSLLEKFGDETDTAAVHLDAAALSSRQAYHVILPVSSMKPTEVYAPNFDNGERVVLVRFPHGGTFEIPELTVNNKHSEAKALLGTARDAIGINHHVAERLSGADFDGDQVLVIPNNNKKVKSTPALEQLKGFDPRDAYKGYEGMPKMTDRQKKLEMGGVSNLITDMTIQGASNEKIARAVKHSMVVIDAQKHDLNYKQSAKDFGIAALKEEYQGKKTAGASTLISRATSETRIPDRKPRPAGLGGAINKETGQREFVPTNARNYKTGDLKTKAVAKLSIADDAHALSSGTPIERIYADHSNRLKALANEARKLSVNTPPSKYDASAKRVYSKEVQSLNAKLALAIRNRPLERQAQIIANSTYRAKLDAKPWMDEPTKKKVKAQAQAAARRRTGAIKHEIEITPEEWNAIQAGAISNDRLTQILAKANIETVRKLATPRQEVLMTPTMNARAKAMFASGATRAEVAQQLGVSLTTLDTAVQA